MATNDDLYNVLLDKLTDPYIRGRIRRALDMDLVLDTWLNGEREESFTTEGGAILNRAAAEFAREAVDSNAIFPGQPMPEDYIRSVFQELLASTALYQAQKYKGAREVDQMDAANAEAILRRFVAMERDGLTGAVGMYFVISAHEDLNAIHYYRRMKREDFLLGTFHRPWSDMMLTNQLDLYRRMGLVQQTFTSDGEMLELTAKGEEVLQMLRNLLEEAGEFEWRANAQRWVIFGETDYDRVFNSIFPDATDLTSQFLNSLDIPAGARVLEIGAGTGRATLDLGLAERVTAAGGSYVALEPSAALLNVLREKCMQREVNYVKTVQGMAEALPFPDASFDLVVSVVVLHFTEVDKAAREMARVTKPGGQIAAFFPGSSSLLNIPMVASWFRPLKTLADNLGVPLGELRGIAGDYVAREFSLAGIAEVRTLHSGGRVIAGRHRDFLQFVLKGAAMFQDLLSRLPFQERWSIIRLLDDTGAEIAASMTEEEQQMTYPTESVFGVVPDPSREHQTDIHVPSTMSE